MLVQYAEFDGVGNCAQIAQDFFVIRAANVRDGIADGVGGFQKLAEDVGSVICEDVVKLREHAGNVFVNMDEAVSVFDFGQLDVWEVDTVKSVAVVSVIDDAL